MGEHVRTVHSQGRSMSMSNEYYPFPSLLFDSIRRAYIDGYVCKASRGATTSGTVLFSRTSHET